MLAVEGLAEVMPQQHPPQVVLEVLAVEGLAVHLQMEQELLVL
jgi:hypothetical protein